MPTGKPGEELAHIYCSGCHLFPEPDLLSRKSWNYGVLPEMAFRLGIRSVTEKLNDIQSDELETVIASGNYPAHAVIAAEDWQKIIDYYVNKAPFRPLPQDKKAVIQSGLPWFSIKKFQGESSSPMVSMVKIDTVHQRFWVASRDKYQLELYDQTLKRLKSFRINSPVSDVAITPSGNIVALEMGNMEPNDSKKGRLVQFDENGVQKGLVSSLNRPVHLNLIDLNADGTDDYLICNYGNETGDLSWYDGQTFQQHLLKSGPGARKTIFTDMDGDGKKDIVALFCQAREEISIFYQREKGQFEETVIQQFPPAYGSSCIDVADMDGDGKPDLLYVNGDNADYSQELKRFHGLRLLINDGDGHFPEKYFFPVHGAGDVKAIDADQDGLMDIAVTAFFPDEKQAPNEGFLLFHQKSNLQFEITTFADAATGRWLVMDTGDLNKDGKTDVLLGNFIKSGLSQKTLVKNGPSFILLMHKK